MKAEEYNAPVYDLCIVGSGPAGIILALEYARLNSRKSVVLIEYGGKNHGTENGLDNSISIANTVNHHHPYECTNKGLGGTSATWGGRCVNYDEVDFMDRPIIGAENTWNLSLYQDVNRYAQRSAKYFECGSANFKLDSNGSHVPIAENFKEGDVTDTMLERWSMPTRFGKRYAAELNSRKNITLMQGFEARDFFSVDNEGVASTLVIRCVQSKEIHHIHSKTFVLAAGTQETTRILLRNTHLFRLLSAIPKALGKYYQGHLSGKIASVKFNGDPKKTSYSFLKDEDGTYSRRRFQFSSSFLVKQNLLNTALWLDNPLYYDPSHKSGAMSFMYLAMITPVLGKKLAPPAIAHSVTKGKSNKVGEHLFNVVKDAPSSLTTPAGIFYKRYCLKRKLPGVFLYSPDNRYALHFHAEQIPDEVNRMELAPDGETLVIKYGLSDADVSSVIKIHEALDNWLQKCNCGTLEYWYEKDKLPAAIKEMSKDGIHQSGTTRIADTPAKGVVDSDLRLWGTKNIYVCSSSVFPTSGQANPTFFLGAFAARLAEHLTQTNENR